MPVLSSVTRPKIVACDVDLGEVQVRVEFNTAGVTLAWSDAMARAQSSADNATAAQLLSQIVVGWDITAEDGSPFPPTAENLTVIPAAAIAKMLTVMQEASAPGAAEGNASPATSAGPSPASMPEPTSSQNGHLTSTSPAPSESLSPT